MFDLIIIEFINKFEQNNKMRGYAEHLFILLQNSFDQCSNTLGRILESMHHMTVTLDLSKINK